MDEWLLREWSVMNQRIVISTDIALFTELRAHSCRAAEWMIAYQKIVCPYLTGSVQRCLTELHYMFITEIIPVLGPHLIFKGTEACKDRRIK